MKDSKGKLHLLPTLLADGEQPEAVIPAGALETTRHLRHFIVENERSARRYLKLVQTVHPIAEIELQLLDKRSLPEEVEKICSFLFEGHDVGLMSEAGMPGIADPGALAVHHCHQHGIEVVPYAGPSSIIMALIASGFNGQQFIFHGYLPIDSAAAVVQVKRMEKDVMGSGYSQIFMETPFRNEKLLEVLLKTCHPFTDLCIACNLTAEHGFVKSMSIEQWKKNKPKLHKLPTIFIIGKGQGNNDRTRRVLS